MSKIGVLLVNLGTPNSPKTIDVRKYLTQFLNDPRVIDIPWLSRKLLVNLIIVPFRAPKSAKLYKELWDEKGSPLLYHGTSIKEKLGDLLGNDFVVELGMRYQNPSIKLGLEKLRENNVKKIIIIPLFPQYASASTGSVMEEVFKHLSTWHAIPEISIVSQFYDHPNFIKSFIEKGKEYGPENYDHTVFSFHGLPVRQLDKIYGHKSCNDHNCKEVLNSANQFCYKATCYETARRIASGLDMAENSYSVAFQSRLGKDPWIEPFTDKIIVDLAKQGKKNMLMFSPAFIADCLETTVEIGIEYNEIFSEAGGEKIQLVESLNDSSTWVEALKLMVIKRS